MATRTGGATRRSCQLLLLLLLTTATFTEDDWSKLFTVSLKFGPDVPCPFCSIFKDIEVVYRPLTFGVVGYSALRHRRWARSTDLSQSSSQHWDASNQKRVAYAAIRHLMLGLGKDVDACLRRIICEAANISTWHNVSAEHAAMVNIVTSFLMPVAGPEEAIPEHLDDLYWAQVRGLAGEDCRQTYSLCHLDISLPNLINMGIKAGRNGFRTSMLLNLFRSMFSNFDDMGSYDYEI